MSDKTITQDGPSMTSSQNFQLESRYSLAHPRASSCLANNDQCVNNVTYDYVNLRSEQFFPNVFICPIPHVEKVARKMRLARDYLWAPVLANRLSISFNYEFVPREFSFFFSCCFFSFFFLVSPYFLFIISTRTLE